VEPELQVGQIWRFTDGSNPMWADWKLLNKKDGNWNGLLVGGGGDWHQPDQYEKKESDLGLRDTYRDGWTLVKDNTSLCAECDSFMAFEDYLCPECRAKTSANPGSPSERRSSET
jgi:hypothetical protein